MKTTRRQILQASAFTAVGASIGAPTIANAATQSPNPTPAAQKISKYDKVRYASIGIGGKGSSNTGSARDIGELVALCDIDAKTLSKGMLENPGASGFTDFRVMLEAMDKYIDAVVVSTPDHTHAPAAAMALRMGKPVYCEKPLTKSIWEARELRNIARRARVATQMGNQGSSGVIFHKAVKLIQSGVFGKIKEIHCYTDRAAGWWPQGVDRPKPAPTPETVDFNLWLGPAPKRPYAPGYHTFAWRGWWDFGCGALGDIGCHCINLPFMALDLRDPIAVTAETSGHNRESFPVWSIVKYEFPERRGRPAVDLMWYDGGKKPSPDLLPGVDIGTNGSIFVFENATVFSPGTYGSEAIRVFGMDEEDLPEVEAYDTDGHFADFDKGVRDRDHKPVSNFEISVPLTETVLLGNLAVWADGDRVEWNARRMRASGDYDELIRPKYREGWKL